MAKAITYVEIDVTFCALVYGEGICQAQLGVTGPRKCFNTLATCQSRQSFIDNPQTIRFAIPTDYLPADVWALPCIENVRLTPGRIAPGKGLGERTSLTVTFSDFKYADTGPAGDPYLRERDYQPFSQGTFFGKFRARQPYLRGRALRLIRGELGQDLSQMEVRHYVIDSFTGPNVDGHYSIVAKDVLKLADGDRSQAPRASSGVLVSDLSIDSTTAVLSPADIGNEEYPTSGLVAIGGTEVCGFTRSGNVLTLTRGQSGTVPQEHQAGDRVQLALVYEGQSPADILQDLLVNYAGVPAEYIPLQAWRDETNDHLRRLYSRVIAEPTSVRHLVDTLIEQAALSLWWDDVNRLIQLQVLREIVTGAQRLDEDVYLENSFTIQDQPGTRISQVWTYFGQINPLRPENTPENYRSIDKRVDLQAEYDYGSPAIHRIYASWIPSFGQQTAFRLGDLQLGRFLHPPRKIAMQLHRKGPVIPQLGASYRVTGWPLQNDVGEQIYIPAQITKLEPRADIFVAELEEVHFVSFDPDDDLDHVITIDGDVNNINAWALHNMIYPEPDPFDPPQITFIIAENVVVGSTQVNVPAFDVGDFPSYLQPLVIVRGRIQGAGGRGGNANTGNGQNGGTAFRTRVPVRLQFAGGRIWGGGGGGASGRAGGNWIDGNYVGGGGGGGAGRIPGLGGAGAEHSENGEPGTLDQGGRGGRYGGWEFFGSPFLRGARAGSGGAPGQPGSRGEMATNSPGSAGISIDGNSLCTITGQGDIRGPRIN